MVNPFVPIQFERDYDVEKMRRLVDDLGRQFESIISQLTDISNDIVSLTLNTVLVVTTTHTAGAANVILVDDDTAGGAVTVFLPDLVSAIADDAFYHVKKLGTTGAVVIDADGSETIDGALTQTILLQFDSFMLVPEASGWHII